MALASGVRLVGGADDCHLVRGRTAVTRVTGLAARLCIAFDAGATWTQASAGIAEQLGLTPLEVMTAGWSVTAALRGSGALVVTRELEV
jgi:hypothetical protein